MKQYTYEVDEAAAANETKARRNVVCKSSGLIDTIKPEIVTLFDVFKQGVATGGDLPYLGRRSVVDGQAGPYTWQSYNEVFTVAKAVG